VVRDADQLSTASGSHSFTATSEVAAEVQANMIIKSQKSRGKFFQQHKSEIDAALTMVQSVLRGHRAREELQEGIEAMGRAAPLVSARAAGGQERLQQSFSDGLPPTPPPDTSRESHPRIRSHPTTTTTSAPHMLQQARAAAPPPVPIASKQPPRYAPSHTAAAPTQPDAPPTATSLSEGNRYSDEESLHDAAMFRSSPKKEEGGRRRVDSRPTSTTSSYISEDLSYSEVSSDDDF
jgi:hypothetical protein